MDTSQRAETHRGRTRRRGGPARAALAVALAFATVPALAVASQPALAQTGDDELPAPGRFDMHPSGQGILRLDRLTGEIALCAAAEEGAWTCRTVVASPAGGPAAAEGDDEAAARPAEDAAARRAAEARARMEAGRDAARRLAGEETAAARPGAPRASAAASDGASEARGRQRQEARTELERLHQENARLTARVDELERRLSEIATIARAGRSGAPRTAADAETDEAIADIDRAVRVGIYALSRFRDLAEVLGREEAGEGAR